MKKLVRPFIKHVTGLMHSFVKLNHTPKKKHQSQIDGPTEDTNNPKICAGLIKLTNITIVIEVEYALFNIGLNGILSTRIYYLKKCVANDFLQTSFRN